MRITVPVKWENYKEQYWGLCCACGKWAKEIHWGVTGAVDRPYPEPWCVVPDCKAVCWICNDCAQENHLEW